MEWELDLRLLEHQKRVFWNPARNIVYVKGRRAGGTEGAVRAVLDRMLPGDLPAGLKPYRKALWVDTVHRNINRYVKRYFAPRLRPLPAIMPNGEPGWHWNGQDLVLSLWNGAYIDFGSSQHPESMEGFGYDVIIVNEAGIILWNEGLYYETLVPMGMEGEGADWWFIGTPKGRNLLNQMYQWGEDGQEGWAAIRHTSFENPLVNREVIERFSRTMPEKTYRQEILAEFLDDANFFSNVAAAFRGQMEKEGEIGIGYTIGLDLAREEDFTVAWVGRADQRRGVLCDRYNKLPWPEQVRRIENLARRFNNAHVVADATGLGGLYAVDDLAAAGVAVEPFTFTSDSKAELMHNLAVELEQARLALYSHPETREELHAYRRTFTAGGKEKFEAPAPLHDDCVCALALMLHGMGWGGAGKPEIFMIPGIGSRTEEF